MDTRITLTFSYTVDTKDGLRTYWGQNEVSFGTWTNGSGDTGGDIDTKLSSVVNVQLTSYKTSVASNEPAVTAISGGTVSIITDDNVDGYWTAIKK